MKHPTPHRFQASCANIKMSLFSSHERSSLLPKSTVYAGQGFVAVSRSMAFDITVKTRVKVDAHLNLKFSASGRVFVAGDIRRRSYDHLTIVLNATGFQLRKET